VRRESTAFITRSATRPSELKMQTILPIQLWNRMDSACRTDWYTEKNAAASVCRSSDICMLLSKPQQFSSRVRPAMTMADAALDGMIDDMQAIDSAGVVDAWNLKSVATGTHDIAYSLPGGSCY